MLKLGRYQPQKIQSSHLKIWSLYVVVVQGQQRNLQKSVLHVQSCCFAHLTNCFFDVPVAS